MQLRGRMLIPNDPGVVGFSQNITGSACINLKRLFSKKIN